MGAFCQVCGADMYICQVCGKDICAGEHPPKWSRTGNVCPECKQKVPVPRPVMEFTREKVLSLTRAYEKEKKSGKGGDDTFVFEGHELVLDYAKYLIEYLRLHFGIR